MVNGLVPTLGGNLGSSRRAGKRVVKKRIDTAFPYNNIRAP